MANQINPGIITRFTNDDMVELIVKYNGNVAGLSSQMTNTQIEILNSNYAIITLPVTEIQNLYDFTEIEYIELPRRLSYVTYGALIASCITTVQNPSYYGLRGNGVLVAVIDSGIDISHPDFINDDGSSKILYLWDQTIDGNPPEGFIHGSEYTAEDLTDLLNNPQTSSIYPGNDIIGHGTAIAGIMSGRGVAPNTREDEGVAPDSSIIAVKLSLSSENYAATTTEIMRAIKYVIDKSLVLNMPISINLSYGTNDGSHNGNSLFEAYIDDMSSVGKNCICVATGNEGSTGHHYSSVIPTGGRESISFTIANTFSDFYISAWKNFVDTMTIEIVSPSGSSTGAISPLESFTRFYLDGTYLYIFYRQPNHYNVNQEIFIQFQFENRANALGLWHIIIQSSDSTDGTINLWLPSGSSISSASSFLQPYINNTLTIPSTASSVISVGGYNSILNTFSDFSGRGPLPYNGKPDLCAPAVNIVATSTGGGYSIYTGTSMASPFVAGAVALMMEWGIVNGNDPFLYGQRIKAFLRQGARREFNITYPNNDWGYGVLNLCKTMENLTAYTRNGGAFI